MAKSKRTKALEITLETKRKVWERQKGKSLFAPYSPISVEECCCHFIPRSQGGLGIEENIFGCVQKPWMNEHAVFDGNVLLSKSNAHKMNITQEEMRSVVRNHFIINYPGWNESKLKYKKGM